VEANWSTGEKIIWIVTLPFRVLFKVARWFVSHPKMLIIGALAVFAVMGVQACNHAFNGDSDAAVEYYQDIAPSVKDAPYVLSTSSRIYYVADYSIDGDVILLKTYYTYDAEKWQKCSLPLPIDKNTFGEYRLYERKP
jgi:hypothetical protein